MVNLDENLDDGKYDKYISAGLRFKLHNKKYIIVHHLNIIVGTREKNIVTLNVFYIVKKLLYKLLTLHEVLSDMKFKTIQLHLNQEIS